MSSFVNFSSFGITPDIIIGDKIPISDILNKEIYIYKVKIDKSKFENRNSSGLRMHLQIKINNERVVTDSLVRAVKDGRIEIEQVPKELVKEVKNRFNG